MASKKLIITTPKDVTITTTSKAGKVTVKLVWASDFGKRFTNNFEKAQAFVDSEVLRFCSARVPFDTGMLQKSGILGTEVGSGEIIYAAPYAARQYYKTAQTRPYDANRGAMWFERGKAVERERILRGAAKLAAGK